MEYIPTAIQERMIEIHKQRLRLFSQKIERELVMNMSHEVMEGDSVMNFIAFRSAENAEALLKDLSSPRKSGSDGPSSTFLTGSSQAIAKRNALSRRQAMERELTRARSVSMNSVPLQRLLDSQQQQQQQWSAGGTTSFLPRVMPYESDAASSALLPPPSPPVPPAGAAPLSARALAPSPPPYASVGLMTSPRVPPLALDQLMSSGEASSSSAASSSSLSALMAGSFSDRGHSKRGAAPTPAASSSQESASAAGSTKPVIPSLTLPVPPAFTGPSSPALPVRHASASSSAPSPRARLSLGASSNNMIPSHTPSAVATPRLVGPSGQTLQFGMDGHLMITPAPPKHVPPSATTLSMLQQAQTARKLARGRGPLSLPFEFRGGAAASPSQESYSKQGTAKLDAVRNRASDGSSSQPPVVKKKLTSDDVVSQLEIVHNLRLNRQQERARSAMTMVQSSASPTGEDAAAAGSFYGVDSLGSGSSFLP